MPPEDSAQCPQIPFTFFLTPAVAEQPCSLFREDRLDRVSVGLARRRSGLVKPGRIQCAYQRIGQCVRIAQHQHDLVMRGPALEFCCQVVGLCVDGLSWRDRDTIMLQCRFLRAHTGASCKATTCQWPLLYSLKNRPAHRATGRNTPLVTLALPGRRYGVVRLGRTISSGLVLRLTFP